MDNIMVNVVTFTPTDRFGSNCHLIKCSDVYAVVDPSVDYDTVRNSHPEIQGKVKYVLLTHCHFDHILEIKSWAEQGATVIVGRADAEGLSDAHINCYLGFLGIVDGYSGEYRTVDDGDRLQLSDSEIRVISTPGHTAGGVCYRIENNLFVGDTVFADGGYGRCDLPGGDITELERSIIKLITREAEATVYPGHGRKTTLTEIIYNFS